MFNQKMIKTLWLFVIITLGMAQIVSAQTPEARINGEFIVHLYGQDVHDQDPNSVTVETMEVTLTFDGSGAGTYQVLASSQPSDVGETGSFTYFASNDGNFVMVFVDEDDVTRFQSVISADGESFSGVSIDSDFPAIIYGIKKSTGNTNAKLSGEYILNLYEGDDVPGTLGVTNVMDVDAAQIALMLDGNGGGTFQELAGTGENLESGTLTYSVNNDGTFTITPGDDAPIRGMVAADGGSFSIVDTNPGGQAIGIGIKKSTGRTDADLLGAYIFNLVLTNPPDDGAPQGAANPQGNNAPQDEAIIVIDTRVETNKVALVFNGAGGGAFEILASSGGGGDSGTFTYAVSDNGTFMLTAQGDEAPVAFRGILNADGRSFSAVSTDSSFIALGSGIKTTRHINFRIQVSGRVSLIPFNVTVLEDSLELDRVKRLSEVQLPENLERRDEIQSVVNQLGDLRVFVPSAAIDDDDITLIFNIRNLVINPLDLSDIRIDPVTVRGQEEHVYFLLRMQVEKDGRVRNRFDFNQGSPATVWLPLGAMQSLISGAGFGDVNISDLTMAFVEPSGFTREGIFTELNPANSELTVRVTHLSDLAGIDANQLAPPPPAAIVQGPIVDPDTTFATVLWRTSQPTDSKVFYSANRATLESGAPDSAVTAADSLGVTDHQVLITGLTKSTKYFYRIKGTDLFRGMFTSPIDSFNTRGIADLAAPTITLGPFEVAVLPDQALIGWETDRRGNSVVRIDSLATLANARTITDPALVQRHLVRATGLTANKIYYYVVSSANGAGTAVSDTMRFTTPATLPTDPPVILVQPRPDDAAVTDTTALIAAVTNVATTMEVFYWVFGTEDTVAVFSPEQATDHQTILTRLLPNTRYRFFARFRRVDNDALFADSRERQFRTRRADRVEPLAFTVFPHIRRIENRRVFFGWDTNLRSNTTIYFQPDPNNTGVIDFDRAFVRADPRFVREHRIATGGLNPATPYLFAVTSEAPNGQFVVWPPAVANQLNAKQVVRGPDGALRLTGIVRIEQAPGAGGRFTTNSGPDTQAPVILSGPNIISQNDNQLVVQWETDELSTSEVQFGAGGNLDMTASDPDLVTVHQVTLTNLSANTSYDYQVSSTDPNNNGPTSSAQAVAVTAASADESPPMIDDASITATPSNDRATIQWTTDEGATTEIQYGTDADSLDITFVDQAITTDHSVTITGLAASTTYFYQVLATDASDNGPSQSATKTFATRATADTAPPTTSNVQASTVAKADSTVSLTVTWTTNKLSTSVLEYDTQAFTTTSQAVGDNTGKTSHSLTVTGLQLGTTYHYRVGSANVNDTAVPPTTTVDPDTTAAARTIDTPATIDTNAPGAPTATAIAGNGAVLLRWTASTDAESGIAGYNISRGGTTIVSNVSDTTYQDNSVANGTAYTYTVVALDKAGNASTASSPTSSVTPNTDQAPTKPTSVATPDTVSLKPVLIVGDATPVSGDASRATLTYQFQVSTEASFTTIIASKTGIAQGTSSNPTHWQVLDPGKPDSTALSDGVKYWWRSRANDGAFDGQWSSSETFIASAGQPSSVQLAAMTATDALGVVTVAWSVSHADPLHAGFHVYRSLLPTDGYVRLTDQLMTGEADFAYVDADVKVGQQYYYLIEAVSVAGTTERFGPISLRVNAPREFALRQNFPNPFNPTTTIKFDLPKPVTVTLVVYNVLGQEVARLIDNEAMEAGFYEVQWSGRNSGGRGTATGVYIYRIEAGEFSKAKKMLLIK